MGGENDSLKVEINTLKAAVDKLYDTHDDLKKIVDDLKGKSPLCVEHGKLEGVKTEVAVLTSIVKIWIDGTEEYRKRQVEKLDRIFNKLELLPCKDRSGNTTQIKILWGFVSAIILAIVVEWIKIR